MGFATDIVTTAAAVVPQLVQADTYRKQGKALEATAIEQQKLANQQAGAMRDTAAANMQRGARNANARMAGVRLNALSSNMSGDGSVAVRERDLATRLQDEINANADSALADAENVRRQGALDAWQTRQAARRSKAQAIGSGMSAVGSLFAGVGKMLE